MERREEPAGADWRWTELSGPAFEPGKELRIVANAARLLGKTVYYLDPAPVRGPLIDADMHVANRDEPDILVVGFPPQAGDHPRDWWPRLRPQLEQLAEDWQRKQGDGHGRQ